MPPTPPTTLPQAAVVGRSDSFGTILAKMVNSHIHRLYVVDESTRPIGVIGLAEVLRHVLIDVEGVPYLYSFPLFVYVCLFCFVIILGVFVYRIDKKSQGAARG